MRIAAPSGLNDSDAAGRVRMVGGAVTHASRGQSTTEHAHPAWKVHIGLDAPVWLEGRVRCPAEDRARVVWVPPGVVHETGAVGWSLAVFVAPGSRRLPWRSDRGARVLTGSVADRLVDVARRFGDCPLEDTAAFVWEIAASLPRDEGPPRVDGRVQTALQAIARGPDRTLGELAAQVGVTPDHLGRLIRSATGCSVRHHALWSRLLGALAGRSHCPNLAALAQWGGFSDHAHLARTCRRFLGRAPSALRSVPDVVAPWSAAVD